MDAKAASKRMQKIAEAVVAGIAAVRHQWRDRGGCRMARHREVRVCEDIIAGRRRGKAKIVRCIVAAVIGDSPRKFHVLPIFPDIGQRMGIAKSTCGAFAVRWRVFYDGFTSRHAGIIDWLTDAKESC